MTEIYADFVADHTFDHLRLRTTRILCREEHTKAVNPDAKAPKSPPNHTKNQVFSVWEYAIDNDTKNTQHTIISSQVFEKLNGEKSVADWITDAINGDVQTYGLELLDKQY